MKIPSTILTAVLLGASVLRPNSQSGAQAPQKMSYQAVIRNNNNDLVTSVAVGIRISILKGSTSEGSVYVETQKPTTNANGVVSLEIGGGNPVSGTFTSIMWEKGPYFIKTETDPQGGTNYTISGVSQMLSVPYALYAKQAENGITDGNQIIAGDKTFSGTVIVNTPVNDHDAATKAYVDALIMQLYESGSIRIKDNDGNYYNTVKIGDQVWMAENLKTTTFNDGTPISLVSDNAAWESLSKAAYCWYDNDPTNYGNTYGALYNWYTVNTLKLCPTGWHIPSGGEWTKLIDHLGGGSVAGAKLKEKGTTHWLSPNTGATNETGFTALPGGYRGLVGFNIIGLYGYWWSSDEYNAGDAWYLAMSYLYSDVALFHDLKKIGFSARCLRD